MHGSVVVAARLEAMAVGVEMCMGVLELCEAWFVKVAAEIKDIKTKKRRKKGLKCDRFG